jgi:hypothetical protein
VDDVSSKFDLPRHLEIVECIDANHMEMARCRDRSDPRYHAILGVLREFMQNQSKGRTHFYSLRREPHHAETTTTDEPNLPESYVAHRGVKPFDFPVLTRL